MNREVISRGWSSQSYSYKTLRSLLSEFVGFSHTHEYMYPRFMEADPALVKGSRLKLNGVMLSLIISYKLNTSTRIT